MENQYNTRQAHDPSQDIAFEGEELKRRLNDEPGSLGIDLDGTNPGSRQHKLDNYMYAANPDPEDEDETQGEDFIDGTSGDDHNTGDERMRIDEEGNEIGENDQV